MHLSRGRQCTHQLLKGKSFITLEKLAADVEEAVGV
jgi:hypothetical protein